MLAKRVSLSLSLSLFFLSFPRFLSRFFLQFFRDQEDRIDWERRGEERREGDRRKLVPRWLRDMMKSTTVRDAGGRGGAKGGEHFGGLERGCRISGGSLTRDWLCRSELMKRPTPVESSEILNFWNFAVRRVYMPTSGLPPTHPRFSAPRVHVPRLRKFFRRISPITSSRYLRLRSKYVTEHVRPLRSHANRKAQHVFDFSFASSLHS